MPENWSSSRDGTLSACERRYYYQYLAQARLNSSDPSLREIAELKKIKSIPAWAGEVFHQHAARYLRSALNDSPPPETEMRDTISRVMTDGWKGSLHLTQQGGTRRSDSTVLFEHEYGIPTTDLRLSQTIDLVQRWMSHFTEWIGAEALIGQLRRARRIWIEPPMFGPGAAGYSIDGVWVFARVDIAYESDSGDFAVIDWKTGKPPLRSLNEYSPEAIQMTVYQLWPLIAYGLSAERIVGKLAYVSEHPVRILSVPLTVDTQENALTRIRRSIARMQQFGGAWTSLGIRLTDLNYASGAGLCMWCGFKRLCQRSVEEEHYGPK